MSEENKNTKKENAKKEKTVSSEKISFQDADGYICGVANKIPADMRTKAAFGIFYDQIKLVSNLINIHNTSNPSLEEENPIKYTEMKKDMDILHGLAKKVEKATEKNKNVKMEDIFTDEDMKNFSDVSSHFNNVVISQADYQEVKQILMDRGIPFTPFNMKSKHGQDDFETYIVFDKKYADDMEALARNYNIKASRKDTSKIGFVSLNKFSNDKQKLGTDRIMAVKDVPAYKFKLLEKLMKQYNLYGGYEYANKDSDNPIVNLYFKESDQARIRKVLLEAEFMDMALTDPKSDLLLKEYLKAEVIDDRIVSEAIELSKFEDYYLCSETTNAYLKLTKDGLDYYTGKDEPVISLKRSDPNFLTTYNNLANCIKNFNLIAIPAHDLTDKTMQENVKDYKYRKKVLYKNRNSRIDFATFDKDFVKELKRSKYKTKDELYSQKVPSMEFVLNVYKNSLEQTNSLDMLKENEVGNLVDLWYEYARNNVEAKKYTAWTQRSEAERDGEFYTARQGETIMRRTNESWNDILEASSKMQVKYNIDEKNIIELNNNIALMLGAKYSDENDNHNILMNSDLNKVEAGIKKLNELLAKMDKVKENIEKNDPVFVNVEREKTAGINIRESLKDKDISRAQGTER